MNTQEDSFDRKCRQTPGLWASLLIGAALQVWEILVQQHLLTLICSAGKINAGHPSAGETIVTVFFRLRLGKENFNSDPFLLLDWFQGNCQMQRPSVLPQVWDIQVPGVPAQLSRVFERQCTNKPQSLWGITNAGFSVTEVTFNGIQQCRRRRRESL